MRILVTGANGQLGRELRNILLHATQSDVTFTDFDELDITDAKAVERCVMAGDFTHIVNCAAYTNVERAEDAKLECANINVNGIRNLAAAADRIGAKIIHISTDYVFDGKSYRPYTESDKVNPTSQYGTTKRLGETNLLALAPESIIIRTAWLYSPYGKNFVKTMLNLGMTQKEIRVVCDQIGTPTSAADLAKAIAVILNAQQWVPGIYHFTDEGACSWYDFAKAIHRYGGITDCNVVPIPTDDYPSAVSRPYYSVLDRTRIKRTYGIEIPHWEDSLRICIDRINKGEGDRPVEPAKGL